MKRLFKVRSVCLLLAMLFSWSVAGAATIIPCTWDGSNATPFSEGTYSQDGNTVTFSLETITTLVFKINDKVYKFNYGDWGSNYDVTEDLNLIEKSVAIEKDKFGDWAAGGLTVPSGTFEFTISADEWVNFTGDHKITRIKDPVYDFGYFSIFNGGNPVLLNGADGIFTMSLPEVIAEKSQLTIFKAKYNVDNGKIASYEEYYVPETNPVPVDGYTGGFTTSTTEAVITFATEIGAYMLSFDPAASTLNFNKETYVAFLKYVKALTGTEFVQSAAEDADVKYFAAGEAFPAAVSAKLSDGTEVTYGPEASGKLPDVNGTFTLVKDGTAKVTSDIYANYKFSYTIDGDKIVVKVIEKTKVFPTVVYDLREISGDGEKITTPAGGAILKIIDKYGAEVKPCDATDNTPKKFSTTTVDNKQVFDLSSATFPVKTKDGSQWGNAYYLLPEGTFMLTISGSQHYTVTITEVEPDKIILRGYYQLNGGAILPMVVDVVNGDSTYTLSLPEVIGTNNNKEDLTVTHLRLLEGYYNDTQKKETGIYRYTYPSTVGDNRVLSETAVAVGGSRSFKYAIADQAGKTDEEFVKYTTTLFQAAVASYDVTLDPKNKNVIFSRKEYVAFPRRIYPNKPDGVQSAYDFTLIPNDVTKEDYVRYQKDETIKFSVLKSLGLGREYTYAPAADVLLKHGATFTLVENGAGKVNVAESAKYKLAYSLDADNNVVVTVADYKEVVDALEVFLSSSDSKYQRALQLKFDRATGHFVGSIFNEFYGFSLRTDKAEYNKYKEVNYTSTDAEYRDFVFSATGSQDGSWTNGLYASSNLIDYDGCHWYKFDAVERPDGDIDMRVVRVEADTVPDNAIVDDYFLVVTKADGSEVEVPMNYKGGYYVEYQTAAGEKYHFRCKTKSILDGETYVVNYYPAGGNGINKDGDKMMMTNCSGQIRYIINFANAAADYIYATPVDIEGNPDANGTYHKYSFNWYCYPYNIPQANRRALTFDLDITVHPDPVLDVCTSTGKHGKLIYNHLRGKNEYALHLDAGEKVWVAELDADDKISHYWVAENPGTKFDVNPGTNITLDGSLFDPDVFKVHKLYKSDTNDNAFVAPEAGDYYVAVSVNRKDPSDKVIKFTKAGFPEKLYLILNDVNTNVSTTNGGNYAKYVVEIPQSEAAAGYYDTTTARLMEFVLGADGETYEYKVIDDPSRLDKDGKLTLNNGDRFFISDQLNMNNMILNQGDLEAHKTGLAWGLIYGGYGSGKNEAVFHPGKNVRMYRGDMKFSGSGVINLDNGGTLIPENQFMTKTIKNEHGETETIYTDQHSYVFKIDLTSSTDPKYSWGEAMSYKGVDYALFGEYADEYGVSKEITETDENGNTVTKVSGKYLPFVYHPQTGLYTLSLKDFYGGMNIGSASLGDAANSFVALKGFGDVVDTSVPFPLFNAYDLDGNTLGGDNERGNNYFMITDPDNAIGCKVSNLGDYGGRDTYVYKNVTLVFDPYSHRLFVDTRANVPDNKEDIDPGKTEEHPMYMIFVRVRDDKDAIGDSYRSWRSWAQFKGGYADLFIKDVIDANNNPRYILDGKQFEDYIAEQKMTDLEAAELASQRFKQLDKDIQQRVADAKIEFFDGYLEIAGYRRMVPLRDNNNHFVTGEWSPMEITAASHHGNGWIDTRRTNVRDGLNTCDESLPDTPERETLAELSYPMYLADESLMGTYLPGGQVSLQSYFEEHNLIAYFFGEKEPVPGESLLEYMSKTVCYGCSEDREKVIRLGRKFDYVAGQSQDSSAGGESGSDGKLIVRIDRRSVGGRRAVLFDYNDNMANTEETPMSPNRYQTSLNFRDPDDRIVLSDNIGLFNFFVMKSMADSRFFVEFDNSTANIWSRVYRYDDKMYIVFNDIQDALADATNGGEAKPSEVYRHTQPRYIKMETVKANEQLDRIVTSNQNLELNYVSKRVSADEYMGKHQRNPYDEDAGGGFSRFYNNKSNAEDNKYSYFTVARKTLSDKGKEFNLHELLTGTYNWLPLAYNENGNRDATCKIKWGEYGEKADKNEIWKTLTEEAILSEPLVINRTGYLNFFSKDFLDTEQNVEDNGSGSDTQSSSRSRSFTKAPAYSAASTRSFDAPGESSETGFISTESDAVDVIAGNVNDMYVDATNTTGPKDEMYVYRAHVVLKGGPTPEVTITKADDPHGYSISYTGAPAESDLLYLERAQTSHVTTGVEDITVDTPDDEAPEFNAVVTVDDRRLTVTGASSISVYTVSGMTLATDVDSFDLTVDPGVYIISADGATRKVLVR